MSAAEVPVVGALLPPPPKGKSFPSDNIHGQLLAYGTGSSVSVAQTQPLSRVCVLSWPGSAATVTAVKWAPAGHGRSTAAAGPLRLAAGDGDGSVVVWDVQAAAPYASLADCGPAQQVVRDYLRAAAQVAVPVNLDTRDSSSGGPGTSGSAAAASAASFGSISSLGWLSAGDKHPYLAVLMAPALLLVWDVLGTGGLVYSCDLLTAVPATSGGPAASAAGGPNSAAAGGTTEVFHALSVDPWQPQRVCCCSTTGSVLVALLSPAAMSDRSVNWRHMRVHPSTGPSSSSASSAAAAAIQPTFVATRHLLVLLLPRELLIADLELGTVPSRTPLHDSMSKSPFLQVVGVYGRGTCLGLGDEGGLDGLAAAHADGHMTTWVRAKGELRLRYAGKARLVPPPLKSLPQASLAAVQGWVHYSPAPAATTSSSSSSGSQLLTPKAAPAAAAAGMGAGGGGVTAGPPGLTATDLEELTKRLKRSLLPDMGGKPARGTAGGGAGGGPGAASSSGTGGGAGAAAAAAVATLHATTVTSDGRLWLWHIPLPPLPVAAPTGTSAGAAPAAPALPAAAAAGGSGSMPPSSPPGAGAAATAAAAATGRKQQPAEPQLPVLQQVMPGLPGAVTALCWASQAVAVVAPAAPAAAAGSDSRVRSPSAGDEYHSSSRSTAVLQGQLLLLAAAGTSSGHVMVWSAARGGINPVEWQLQRSFLTHPGDPVKAVKWLGRTPWVVSCSTSKVPGRGVKNTLLVTNVMTGYSYPFRTHVASEGAAVAMLRASPSGAYLVLMFKGQPAELWAMPHHNSSTSSSSSSSSSSAAGAPGSTSPAAGEAGSSSQGHVRDTFVPPYRLRLIDLSFTALEWACSEGHPQHHPHQQQQDALTYWLPDGTTVSTGAAVQQQPTTPTGAAAAAAAAAAGGASSAAPGPAAGSDAQAPAAAAAPAAGGEFAHLPWELLVYSLSDGRSGTLTVRGRVVKDAQPTRPSSGPGPHDMLGTAAAATGSLVFLGDSEGQLLAWDTASGRCSRLTTGQGLIRRVLAVVGTATTAAAAGALLTTTPSAPAAAAGAAPRRSFMSGGSATNSSSSSSVAAAAAAGAGSGAAGAGGSPNGSGHGGNAGTVWIRLAVLFAKGTVGVYDVDGLGRLRPSLAQPAAIASSVGRVTDLGWVPAPGSIGAGTLLSVVTEEGGLAVLDVSAPPAAPSAPAPPPSAAGKPPLAAPAAAGGSSGAQAAAAAAAARRRLKALRKRLLETSWSLMPAELQQQQLGASHPVSAAAAGGGGGEQQHPRWMQAQLVAPPPPSCGLLLPPAQQQLVRLLLQLGTSVAALHKLSLAPGAGDQEVLDELLQLLPPAQAPPTPPAAAAAAGVTAGPGGAGSSPMSESSSSMQGGPEADQQQQQLTSEGLGGLVSMLRAAAAARGTGGLLQPAELTAYCSALNSSNTSSSSGGSSSSSIADRMAAAAGVAGSPVEARFWQLLPASLKSVKELQEVIATAAAAVAAKKAAQQAAAAAAPPLPYIKTSSSTNNMANAASSSSSMAPAGSQPPPALAATIAASDHAESTTPTAAAIDAAVAAFAASQAAADGGAAAEGQQEAEDDPDALDADDYERLVQGAVGQVPVGGSSSSSKPAGSAGKGPGDPHTHHQQQQRRGVVLPGHVKATGAGGRGLPGVVAAPLAAHRRLWEPVLAVQECQERLAWHEAMPPSSSSLHSSTSSGSLIVPFAAAFAHQYQIRELRLLEYVVLGDYAAAVAVLLAEPPEHSMRWYRGVVCALSLAAAASVTTAGHSTQTSPAAAAATALQLQAAKVVSAHAVGLGDMALGVHLNCSAGNFAEATAVLQEAGLWRLAAALAAARLTGTEASVVLSRWAAAVAALDGGEGLWRAVGLWTAAGCLRSAATALLDAGLPDAAHAYVAACQQAGLLLPPAGGTGVTPSSSSSNLSTAAGASTGGPKAAGEQQQQALSSAAAGSWAHTKPLVWSWALGWHQAGTEGVTEGTAPAVAPLPLVPAAADGGLYTIRRISGAGKGLAGQDDQPLLFDMLGHRSTAAPGGGGGGGTGGVSGAAAGPGGGQGLLQRVHAAYEGYVRQLVSAATSAGG